MRNLSFARPTTRYPSWRPGFGAAASRAPVMFRLLVALTIALVWGRGAAPVLASEPGGVPAASEVAYYVDNQQEDASDQNTGFDRGAPLRTVGVALARARGDILAGKAARIIIANGTYRESLTLNFSDQEPASGAALVIEAAEPGKVTISGSDVYTDWQPLGAGVYAHPWPFKWGFAENPWTKWNVVIGPLALRGEMVFVNGERLRQVLTDDDLRAASMTFLVDEDKERILMHVGDSVQIADALIEVATRGHVLHVRNGKNITLRGIRFQHAGKPRRAFAVFLQGEGFIIDQCAFENNNDIGLRTEGSQDIHILRSKFNHNGFHGLNTIVTSLLTVDDSEISYNNWRGALARFFTWDPSNKQAGAKDHVWNKMRFVGNQASALWFDGMKGQAPYDNTNITIKNSTFIGNGKTAVDIEASSGSFHIYSNVFCMNNNLYADIYDKPIKLPAVLIWDSQNVRVRGNMFFNNFSFSIGINYDDSRLFSKNVEMTGNIIIGARNSDGILMSPSNLGERQISIDFNRYIYPSFLKAFLLIDKNRASRNNVLDFAEWQKQTGLDRNSSWEERTPDQIPQGCELSPAQ